MSKKIVVQAEENVLFNNHVDFCLGTGRMGLALHKEYLDQLKLVQDTIGFRYIRGHGLFSDDMAFCRSYDDQGRKVFEYNYTYLDRVIDSYLELGLRPFLELGFMPEAMASGDQKVFYWKGNVTPPEDYSHWSAMVKALLEHFIQRYGREVVIQWPVEVWNEPNLPVFWKGADMEAYFKLYAHSARAVKEVDPAIKVGGPAICGVDDQRWLKCFLDYVKEQSLPLDFVTRHHYTSELPDRQGHYSYIKLHDLDESFRELEKSRELVDSFNEYRGMDIHITEFNTSYVPDAPIHDTNLNAAYVASLLSRLGDKHASYSYWTFGDVFEEKDVPFTPFHGGFGMVANHSIPKPTFWTFVFFKKLQGHCIHKSEHALLIRTEQGSYRGLLWFADTEFTGESISLDIQIPEGQGEFSLISQRVDEDCCNPLKLWHHMGEPSHLSGDQLTLLKDHARPLLQSQSVRLDGGGFISFELGPNGMLYFELTPVQRVSDRGYSYDRVIRGE